MNRFILDHLGYMIMLFCIGITLTVSFFCYRAYNNMQTTLYRENKTFNQAIQVNQQVLNRLQPPAQSKVNVYQGTLL